jgi:dolichyl-phosphate beta-glucosyltransferase
LKLDINQGKGGAIQQGMLHARGKLLLMVDSDGATKVKEVQNLEQELLQAIFKGKSQDVSTLASHFGVAIGSRRQYRKDVIATRKWYRNILSWGFNFLVSTLCVHGVRDTQCGFKLFTRASAQHLFFIQQIRRWSFDVELLHVAQQLNHPLVEVPVNWQEIPGSKLDIIQVTCQLGRDVILIRLAYLFGIWKMVDPFTSPLNSHIRLRRK